MFHPCVEIAGVLVERLLRFLEVASANTISTCREFLRIGRKSIETEVLEEIRALHWRDQGSRSVKSDEPTT